MKHTVHHVEEDTYHRFDTDRGRVWAVVSPYPNGVGKIAVYEHDAVVASHGLTDDEAHQLASHSRARNQFGYKIIRRVLRAVVRAMPEITRWEYERKSGANVGRLGCR